MPVASDWGNKDMSNHQATAMVKNQDEMFIFNGRIVLSKKQ